MHVEFNIYGLFRFYRLLQYVNLANLPYNHCTHFLQPSTRKSSAVSFERTTKWCKQTRLNDSTTVKKMSR